MVRLDFEIRKYNKKGIIFCQIKSSYSYINSCCQWKEIYPRMSFNAQ